MEQPKNAESGPLAANDNPYEWIDDLGDKIVRLIDDTTYAICNFINDLAVTISGL